MSNSLRPPRAHVVNVALKGGTACKRKMKERENFFLYSRAYDIYDILDDYLDSGAATFTTFWELGRHFRQLVTASSNCGSGSLSGCGAQGFSGLPPNPIARRKGAEIFWNSE
jgi:hypothetical protein